MFLLEKNVYDTIGIDISPKCPQHIVGDNDVLAIEAMVNRLPLGFLIDFISRGRLDYVFNLTGCNIESKDGRTAQLRNMANLAFNTAQV